MKTYIVKDPPGIIDECECLTDCPHCTRPFRFEEFEDTFMKSKGTIRKKCKGCKRFVGITQQLNGDFITFEL